VLAVIEVVVIQGLADPVGEHEVEILPEVSEP